MLEASPEAPVSTGGMPENPCPDRCFLFAAAALVVLKTLSAFFVIAVVVVAVVTTIGVTRASNLRYFTWKHSHRQSHSTRN